MKRGRERRVTSTERRNIVLFTGQSGIKIKDGLNGLLWDGFGATLFSVEQEMQKISGKGFLEILSAPPKIQEALSARTWEEMNKKLSSVAVSGKYGFVTFHASYYHQRKRDFLSPVSFANLLALKDRVKMVVVFIDDCYDIYKRLMGHGEMFGYVRNLSKVNPQRALLVSIMNLLSILEWREIEVAFSRKIARLLEVPLYVFAVKHPKWMLPRLIASGDGHDILYLSHPISSIIRGIYPRPPSFYQELNSFIELVLAKDTSILFIPDAIDEKGRIKKNKETGRYVPELLDGWPLPFSDDWLFTPLPTEVNQVNPLNPGNVDVSTSEESFQITVSVLLEVLLEKISHQVNSRDLSLVEQSRDGVVLYRPYWGATLPGGVEEELKYNHDLAVRYGESRRRVIIINAAEDLAKWRIKSLSNYIASSIYISESSAQAFNNLCGDWLNKPEMVAQFEDVSALKTNISPIREDIESVLPEGYQFVESIVAPPSSTLGSAPMLAEKEKHDRGWEDVANNIPAGDPFRDKYFISDRDVYVVLPSEKLKDQLPKLIEGNFAIQVTTEATEGTIK